MNNPIAEFENMRDKAELKALSKISLERELNDKEFNRMKELSYKVLSLYSGSGI